MKFNLYFHKVEIKPTFILLPTGASIVLPVGYRDQPTGLLHIILLEEVMWQAGEEVYSDYLLRRLSG